jgi:CHAT domain-containing protein
MANSEFPSTYRVPHQDESEDISFDQLPGVHREGRVVGGLLGVEPLTDAEATSFALLELPRGVPILHIATHGLLFLPHPESSFLAMADGPLSVNTLYRYDRGVRAGLVVLSACQTGLGHQHPDSQIGLANAFLVAGAHTVVSTLWEIPDDDTVTFMEVFYGQVMKGMPIPACVQAAQRALIASGAPVESWGAFKATGRMASPALPNRA